MLESDKEEKDYNIDFERIVELISKYDQIKKSGEIRKYNEESTKKDFIQPLFEALGWNTSNRGKRNDSISAEETISKKRVDYGFRINGIPKFFLEAKSLKEENIQTNAKYVTQAIDYAWMKSCSWAILTNFETIALYNADWKSGYFGGNLFFVLHPSDFLNDSRFVNLSKGAFENNELDRLASKYGKKQVKNPINKQLLQDMIHFREILSKDIVRNNQDKHLSQDDLDESVQRILDRLIFIRNAEDRGLEENQLQSHVRQWNAKGRGHLLKEISRIYADYDKNYNSKLFDHHLCDDLYIENEALQEVIEGLNHSKDNSYRYDFSIIESDVLGNIYEQYLGNILKYTPKRAKLEESKTHRKEQGIYYTPSYIVDYIVKNTVGEYIKTHTPEEIRKVRILDPACGSGSFLIRTYKELEYYWKNYNEKNKAIPESAKSIQQAKFDTENSEEFYTLKTDILRNNIFGVDLDPKAVEIAQLNLLLQISERKHRLPLLQNNIKIGNSLIDDPSVSDKAFKWEDEFTEIMKEGGFDIVIGNPPYVNIKFITKNDDGEKIYYEKRFYSATGNYDLYVLFIQEGIQLLKGGGLISLIVPNKFMVTDYGKRIRNYVLSHSIIEKFVDVSDLPIFKDVGIYPIIFVFKRENDEGLRLKNKIKTNKPISEENFVQETNYSQIEQRQYLQNTNEIFTFGNEPIKNKIIGKMKVKTEPLSAVSTVNSGTTGFEYTNWGKYISERQTESSIPFIITGNIEKYLLNREKVVRYQGKELTKPYFKKGEEVTEGKWKLFTSKKIVIRGMALRLTAAFDELGCACGVSVYTITNLKENIDLFFLLGILNSELIDFYYKSQFISKHLAGKYIGYNKGQLEQIPIKIIDKIEQVKISSLVKKCIAKRGELLDLQGKKNDENYRLTLEIEQINRNINYEIYKIYNISEDEQKFIKGH
ncbi:MAG: Eco57I restriction-modification methylase domain-containing protein [Thermoplasmataceae archaeon]